MSPTPLGKYGTLHRNSLVENRPEETSKMPPAEIEKISRQVNSQAEARMKLLLEQGMDHDQAEEIVMNELVLMPNAETQSAMQDGYRD